MMHDNDQKETEDRHNGLLSRLLRMAGSRPSVPEDVRSRVQLAVHDHWKKQVAVRLRRRFRFLLTGAIAASLLIYFLMWQFLTIEKPVPLGIAENVQGTVLKNSESESLIRGRTLMSGSTLETGHTGKLLIRLLGGVTLRLDRNSRLHLKSGTMYVLEKGAMYLDCNRSGTSITLSTPMGTVRDSGTQFEVRLEKGKMQIQVREGSVLLEQKETVRTVTAGKKLIVNDKGSAFFSEVSPSGPEWNWISEVAPRFTIEGRSLMEFLNWVTRENGWTLRLAEPSIRDDASKTILHGSIVGLSPQEMIAAVLPVCGFTYSVENDVLYVRPGLRNERK